MTGVGGAIVVLLQVVLPGLGINLTTAELTSAIEAGVVLVGTVMLIYGQVRRDDVKAGILKK